MVPKPLSSILCCFSLTGTLAGCTHNHYYYSGSDAIQVEGSAPLTLGKASPSRGTTRVVGSSPSRVVSGPSTYKSVVTSNLCDESDQTIVLSNSPQVVRKNSTKPSGSRVVISRPTNGAVARNMTSDGWYPITRSSRVDRLVSTDDLGDPDSPERR